MTYKESVSGGEAEGALDCRQASASPPKALPPSSSLHKLKSSMSDVKSSIDEMTQSNSVYTQQAKKIQSKIQQQSSKSSSSQSKVQSSKIQQSSNQSLSNVTSSASTTALKSSKTTSSTSSVKSSKSTNNLQSSNFVGLQSGSTENLGNFSIVGEDGDFGDDDHQLIESFKDPGELLLKDPHDLLNDQESLLPDERGSSGSLNGGVTLTQKKSSSSKKTKVTSNNNTFESASGRSSQSTRLQAGDVTFTQGQTQAKARTKMERDGRTEEKEAALHQEASHLQAGDEISVTEGSQRVGASHRVTGQDYAASASTLTEQQQRQTVTPAGCVSSANSRKHSRSGVVLNSNGNVTTHTSSMSSSESNISVVGFEDLDLSTDMNANDVKKAISKYSDVMSNLVGQLKVDTADKEGPNLLENINAMMKQAWSIPVHGHELGYSLCKVLRQDGGLDVLLENCTSEDETLKFSSAKVLEQCLTIENRGYVVESGLKDVINVACDCLYSTKDENNEEKNLAYSRVGTGILSHLFKHSEGTCTDIISMGGLEAVVKECRQQDVETLRHCAAALANLSLYGGSENQQQMVKKRGAAWLFHLAFNQDANIKYYACLAIAALVANTEIEAQVVKDDIIKLIESFVNSNLPEEFANSCVTHKHGQSKDWLQRLVPVLNSKREEARNLAAFHFCMEAGIKKNQNNLAVFEEIGAIEPLKQVASSPNAIASKWAAHALRLMNQEVPHKLSQQVPLWEVTDVQEWVKQIGFDDHIDAFVKSRVDGDLLLQIKEENLRYDINITNGFHRSRFMRELKRLRQIADYSSKDSTGLNQFLLQLEPEFAEYTYQMLLAGVTTDNLRNLTEEQLLNDCCVENSIHRHRIQTGSNLCEVLKRLNSKEYDPVPLKDSDVQPEKNLDVFISYRRSNGSQLASLLKVHMQLRGFSTFIDVERLEAGKFDNNLLSSIRQARHFLLVLTPNALDRCFHDTDGKDWVHKEIVCALENDCNIIPIVDNFTWPETERLPEDMRNVCTFNAVRWIHDYQDACVDKLERFMRGEGGLRGEHPLSRYQSSTLLTQPGTPSPLPRAPPHLHRNNSIDSNKGSICSD